MNTITQAIFKATAKSIQSGLAEHGIPLKQQKSRQLLSHALSEKAWRSLSPALPITFNQPGPDEAIRMSTWLTSRSKPISTSTCETILHIAFNEASTDWFYSVDLQSISTEIAPLLSHIEIGGSANKGVIIINPDHKTVSCHTAINPGNPQTVYGRSYEFEVPGNIRGKALVDILTHPDFLSLLETISNNWYLEWDDQNYVGKLDNQTKEDLEYFHEWLTLFDPECCYVSNAEEFLEPVIGIDCDGEELEVGELDGAISISVMDSIKITPSSNTDVLLGNIKSYIDHETVIIGLERYIDYCYEVVCKNSTNPA